MSVKLTGPVTVASPDATQRAPSEFTPDPSIENASSTESPDAAKYTEAPLATVVEPPATPSAESSSTWTTPSLTVVPPP